MPTYRYEIDENPMIVAINASRAADTQLAIVFDRDESGEVLRIGYALANRGEHDSDVPITWFAPQEVTRVLQEDDNEHSMAVLDIAFQPEVKNKSFHLVELPARKGRARLRSLIRIHRSNNVGFAIQIEVQQESGIWDVVVRYDSAHDSLHRDLMSRAGKMIKYDLPVDNACDAIEYAYREIASQLSLWIEELGYEFSCTLEGSEDLERAVSRARDELLGLWKIPGGIASAESRLTIIKESPDHEQSI